MPLDHYNTLGRSGLRVSPLCLARILHQAAQRAIENTLISHAVNPFFEPGPGHKPR